MNQRNLQFAYSAARSVVAAATVAVIFLASNPATAATNANSSRVETRIADIHSKLKITAAEEDQWAKVAKVMRENDKKMDELTDARLANEKNMNAIDDLKSYGNIVDEHADGIKRFTPVFATLYDNMSDSQKVEADKLFHHEDEHKGHHHHKI